MKSKQNDKNKKKEEKNGGSSAKEEEESSSQLSKTVNLFRRVPTLAALFCEVISFQSLSTVLAICFVRQLKESMPLDSDRASFTGLFFAYINGSSGLMQFFVLPLARPQVFGTSMGLSSHANVVASLLVYLAFLLRFLIGIFGPTSVPTNCDRNEGPRAHRFSKLQYS